MHRLGLAIMLGIATIGTVAAGSTSPVLVEGKGNNLASNPALAVDAQAQQAIDAATAAALIGALQTRFDGQPLELRLGDVHSERVSLQDIALNGDAKIKFAGADAWLPVSFQALYDTSRQTVESPHITLGASAATASADNLPLDKLQARVDAAMTSEFLSQDVDFQLNDARVVGDDGARLVVQGGGLAQFDDGESAPVLVRALYDRNSGRWIDAQYDFDALGTATHTGNAVAAR